MTYTGKLRIFFNVHNEAPRVWCIRPADNSWEIAVVGLELVGVLVESHYERHTIGKHDLYEPSAWFSTTGELLVTPAGLAVIRRATSAG